MTTAKNTAAQRVTLSVTLASGQVHSFHVARMPRHWKSWVMQQLPYGTDYVGCTWARTREEA